VHSTHIYEVKPRKDHRGVDLISDALPFGRLWLQENNRVSSRYRSVNKFHTAKPTHAGLSKANSAGIGIASRRFAVMHLTTLPQSGSIIDLDRVSFVIKIQSKTGGRGIRIGLGHSELQIITPDDARRFLEELRESKQVNVENLLKWIRLTPTSIIPPAEPLRPATSP